MGEGEGGKIWENGIETCKIKNIEKINEENGPKGRLRVSKNDFNELKGKVNDFEDKLAQINEALDQSKLKYY